MIRRLTEADVKTVQPWLKNVYQEDPETGGNPDVLMSQDKMKQIAQEDGEFWVCIENGEPVGVLVSSGVGQQELEKGKAVFFNVFCLLAIDYALYQVSRGEATRVARELTLAAADDLTARGDAKEYIYVYGPTDSRGASWCRLLKMEETARKGGTSTFLLPFKEIWERAKATEATTRGF